MTSVILAVDPGSEQSALLAWDGHRVLFHDTVPNLQAIDALAILRAAHGIQTVVIEGVACYGMAVGKEVFDTCIVIGRLMQRTEDLGMAAQLVYRRDIKLHHCGDARAKDSNIRQALLDKYGPQGTKKAPGPVTYGLSKHLWSAFAIATWHSETKQGFGPPPAPPSKA